MVKHPAITDDITSPDLARPKLRGFANRDLARRAGAKGGRNGHVGGFSNPDVARRAGTIGKPFSRRVLQSA